MAKFEFQGVTYSRGYKVQFCAVCGKRILFRLSAKGVPEGSDKNNKRQTCCPAHARILHARLVSKEEQRKKKFKQLSPIDKFIRGI